MGATKKPRKAYRPKPVLVDPVGYVTAGVSKLSAYDSGSPYRTLLLRTYSALDAVRGGTGTSKHAEMLLGMLEVAEVLIHEHGIGVEHSAVVSAARPAVIALIHRGERLGRFVFTGPELAAVTALMNVHEDQLRPVTVSTLDKVLAFLRRQNGTPPAWLKAA